MENEGLSGIAAMLETDALVGMQDGHGPERKLPHRVRDTGTIIGRFHEGPDGEWTFVRNVAKADEAFVAGVIEIEPYDGSGIVPANKNAE
ncbi:MAG: hypothetical protein WC773_04265 [Patescibacteria group bacterium]|jgi:hypothetical protein